MNRVLIAVFMTACWAAAYSGCKSTLAKSLPDSEPVQSPDLSIAWPSPLSFPPCNQPNENASYHNYAAAVLNRLVLAIPELAGQTYELPQLCILSLDHPLAEAFSSPQSGRIVLNTGLLFLRADQTDADLAAVLAHHLAHIALQHGVREPALEELPSQVDAKELQRRFRVRSVFADKLKKMRDAIVREAKTDDIFASFAWALQSMEDIVQNLRTLSKRQEAKVLDSALSEARNLKERYSSVIAGAGSNEDQELSFIMDVAHVVHTLTTEIAAVDQFLSRPLECSEEMPCELIQRLGRIENYHEKRVLPAWKLASSARIPPGDDPLSYEPYANWLERQASLAGSIIYTRAGFSRIRAQELSEILKKSRASVDRACEPVARLADDLIFQSGASDAQSLNLDCAARELTLSLAGLGQDIPGAPLENLTELSGQLERLRQQFSHQRNDLSLLQPPRP